MDAEFEEKEYEQYINIEFAKTGRVYAPGQRFEFLIGIDAAISFFDPHIWNTFGYKRPFPSGVYLTPELWDFVEEDLKTSKFPDFKCNIFVQYKRPEYISRFNGAEYKKYWKQPYFRYEIKKNGNKTFYII